LVEETVALFNEKTVALRADEASAAIQFYAEQVRVQGERLTQAALAVQQFEDAHPIRRGQPRPVAEQQELDLLRRQLTLEQTAYETTLGKAEDVRLKGEAAISGEDRSFQVVDPPKAPSADGVSKKALMTAVFAGGVLGVMLAALPVLYLTWTDNRIRSRSDVERVLKPRFIAEVPFVTAPAGPPLDPTRHALSRGGEQPL
jgi:uncharacterized protein involved in exopolysaccharide biosynthesis